MQPHDLPHFFTVAEGRDAGLSPGALRSRKLQKPYWGARSRDDLDDEDRLRLLLAALPARAFACGATAAIAWGLPLPWHERRRALLAPLIGVPLPHNRIRRPGVRGRALAVGPADVAEVRGIRCTSPERTWCELAGVLPFGALVALTDRLLFRGDPLTTRAALLDAHVRIGRSRGAAQRPLALEWAIDRAESPRESELRVLLREAGLAEPECNVDIVDRGRLVARVDMLFRHARLVVEYDGDYHRDPRQWSRDAVRRAELESLGYRVTVVTARDFDDPAALVRRIRRLLSA